MSSERSARVVSVERPYTREWMFGERILGHDYDFYYKVAREIVTHVNGMEIPVREYLDDVNLRRSRYVAKDQSLGVFSGPVGFHIDCLDTMPDSKIKGSLAHTLRYVVEGSKVIARLKGKEPQDVVHAALKQLTHHADVGKLSRYPASTVLAGLDRCTPAVKWDRDELIQQLDEWVGPNKVWAVGCENFVVETINELGKEWLAHAKANPVSFDAYIADPFNWATSGGAPAVNVDGSLVRSKWAWAIKNLESGCDLYKASANRRTIATAALKEEPSKTRLIITTPMRSYLRQCYFMHVMGFPRVKSPLVDEQLPFSIPVTTADWYASIDATKFDHQIPKWFVRLIFDQIARHPLLAELVEEEWRDIENTKVSLFNTYRRYEGGVLSGWRMTSLIGTLASVCVCEYIRTRYPNVDYLVQGDDVMLYGREPIPASDLKLMLDQFGLKYSEDSTLVGREGVFLRRRYGRGPLRCQAGRALRQLFYANPWVTRGQFSGPRELANSWLQYMSRMAVPIKRKWLLNQAAADMARWSRGSGWGHKIWFKLLTTDSGYGGLGTVDTNTAELTATVIKLGPGYNPNSSAVTPHDVLLSLVAPHSPRDSLSWMKTATVSTVPLALPRRPEFTGSRAGVTWPADANKFRILLDVLRFGRRGLPSVMQRQLPHHMRTTNGVRLVQYLLHGVGQVTAPMHTCFPQIVVSKVCEALLNRANAALWWRRGSIRERQLGYYRHILSRTFGRFMLSATW